MNDQNFKNLCLKFFYFCKKIKKFENLRILFIKSANFFVVYILHKENMFTIEIEYGRETP